MVCELYLNRVGSLKKILEGFSGKAIGSIFEAVTPTVCVRRMLGQDPQCRGQTLGSGWVWLLLPLHGAFRSLPLYTASLFL